MKFTNEMKIGILVFIVIAILAVLTWETGNFDFSQNPYHIKVVFKNIDGVALNAPVTLNGLEVGRVEDIQIIYGKETRVELKLWLKQEAKIREGAQAYVKNMGFLGEKYVALTSGDDQKRFLKPGAVIEGREPSSFDDMLSEGQQIAVNLKEISEQVNERLKVNSGAIDDILANLRTTTKNLSSISANVHERLDSNKTLIDDTLANIHLTSKNLEELSLDLKLNPWKLMYKQPEKKTE